MTKRPSPSLKSFKGRAERRVETVAQRFARTDGRFDLPVVAGRTPREVARRLT